MDRGRERERPDRKSRDGVRNVYIECELLPVRASLYAMWLRSSQHTMNWIS